jgi:sugar O-acyltransferase (sialic acid O-acetyltransferase NeuD family)
MSQGRAVAVIGAGGHGKVVLATLAALGLPVEVVLDDDPRRWGESLMGTEVLGPVDRLAQMDVRRAVVAVGANRTRQRLVDQLEAAVDGLHWVVVVHPSAVVHPTAILGPGTMVMAGAVVQPDARLGAHTIVNTAATVDHDCRGGDFVHLAPGVHLGGEVRLGEGAFLGIGAVAVPGAAVGDWAVVGAGATVVREVPPGVTAVGTPARPLAGHGGGGEEA